MGQCTGEHGGKIFLVESPDDVDRVVVDRPDEISYVTQTTLSVDDASRVITALKRRFPEITGPKKDDICYATQNRQDAVKALAEQCDLLLVVGSPNSSNSNRLKELAKQHGTDAYLIDGADDIQPEWLSETNTIGVTAGASAPEVLVQDVIKRLEKETDGKVIEAPGIEENITFSLPKGL